MNRTLLTAISLSLSLLATGVVPAQAGDIPSLPTMPTMTLATALVGRQGADDEFNAGVEAQRNRNYDKAVLSFSNAVKKDPTYWVAYYSRAECYMELKQFEKAIADFTQVIDKKPKLADAYRYRGRAYNKLNQPDKAIEDLNKALQIKGPNFFEIYADLAQSYLMKKDYQNAISNYTVFIDRIKRTRQVIPGVYSDRGNAYLIKYQSELQENKGNEEDVKLALADFEEYIAQATAKNMDPSDAYLSRADAYLITKNYDKAISNYTLFISKNAKDSYALERRGVAYEGVKNMAAARKDFEQAIALNPTSANAQAGYTRTLLEDGDPEQAIAALSKGISNPPKKEQKEKVSSRGLLYMRLAEVKPQMAAGYYANAIQDFDYLLKQDPTDKSALANRATANLKTNAYEKALADYDAYLALKPTEASSVANALTGKATALNNLKRYDQAATAFGTIITNNEAAKVSDPDPYYNRALAFYNYGVANNDKATLKKALPDLEVYLKAKPDSKDANKLKTDIELQTVTGEEQIAVLTRAIQSQPNNSVYRLNLGALLFQQGEKDPAKYDQAIAAYSDAIKVSDKDPVGYYGRAAVYSKKKDWDNVIKDTTAALTIKADYSEALSLRAQANLEAKKYTDAIRDYEAARVKDPNNVDALKGLAFSYVANKDYANTVRIMDEYIPKHPEDLEAVYSRGVANVGLMKYPAGIADLTKYIDGGGKDKAVALYNRGLANAKSGNEDAAAGDYEASLTLKNDANVALEAAKIYGVQGDKFRDSDPMKAVTLYGKAYDIYGKALTGLDAPDVDKTDLPKRKAAVLRSQAVVRQSQGQLAESLDILKDALALFNKYLAAAKPLNLPDVADTEKIVIKLDKYIKDNS